MKDSKIFIGVDGLIAIAKANGMSMVSYDIDYEACYVALYVDGVEHAYSYTMDDVRADGKGDIAMWRRYYRFMFSRWALGKAIRTHFKDAVEAAERALAV